MIDIAIGIYAPLIGLLCHALLQPIIWLGRAAEWLDDKMERWMAQ